jgi:formylglycine-generating enzyme required for sulfatase activity/tRNA A-37 threonylcarbamoyl transferase component Bud32
MGVVYRAVQVSMGREVAIKVLPPHLVHDQARLERFRREARLAGALTDANILPVFDVLDIGGVPILVMPFVDGADLGRVIADRRAALRRDPDPGGLRHRWAALGGREYLDHVLPVLDRVAEAVARLHEAGVTHRDVKPSNVLIDRAGNVWLTDFGLARLGDESTLTTATAQIGSPGYMSPEQWASRGDLDRRVDVFGLGATAWHALTLYLPYGAGRLSEATRPVPLPRRWRAELGADLGAVVVKALEPDRRDRYESAVAFRDDWQRVRRGELPEARPLGTVGRWARRAWRHPWGVSDAIAAAAMAAVLMIGWNARRLVPGVTTAPAPFTRTVVLDTQPTGARVAFVPLDPTTGEPLASNAIRPPGTTPQTVPKVPPGDYLVVVELPKSGRFHEVLRHVPGPQDLVKIDRLSVLAHYYWSVLPDGRVALPGVAIPFEEVATVGLARFEGDPAFLLGASDRRIGLKQHPVRVEPFWIETTEVTVGAYRSVWGGLPPPVDGADPSPPHDVPVVGMTFDQAVAYAERVGRRLPTEEEYEFAATVGGRYRFPWGDSEPPAAPGGGTTWRFGPVGSPDDPDRTPTSPPVFGLFSNVAEWTGSSLRPYPGSVALSGFSEFRVVRGATPTVLTGKPPRAGELFTPRFRQTQMRSQPAPGLGFRCARSVRPRFLDD